MYNQPTIKRHEEGSEPLKGMSGLFFRRAKAIDPTPRPEFKEALRSRLLKARQTSVGSSLFPFSFSFFRPGWVRNFSVLGTTIVAVAVLAAIFLQPFGSIRTVYAQDNFTLIPENADTLGVQPNSTYRLDSKGPVKAADIEKMFSTNAGVSYKIEQISNKSVRIAFEKPLDPKDVVSFQLASTAISSSGETVNRPYAWAFQIKSPFRVLGTIPGRYATNVPLDSAIEFQFSHENIDPVVFEKALTITPALAGHVEPSRRTFVFVPDKLQSETLYTVKLSGSLQPKGSTEALGDDYLFQFETSADETRSQEFFLQEHYLTVAPSQTPTLFYSAWQRDLPWGGDENDKIHVDLYRFLSKQRGGSDYDQFAAAIKKASTFDWSSFSTAGSIADLSSLSLAVQFDTVGIKVDWQQVLAFPKPLERGYYLADVSLNGRHAWSLIQSSDLTAYVAKAVDRTLVWVNRVSTHDPVAGARVSLLDVEGPVTTGEDGIGYVSAEGKPSDAYLASNLLEIKEGEDAILLLLAPWEQAFVGKSMVGRVGPVQNPSSNYWTYLYTDRPLYKSSDTVHFWGYLEPRDVERQRSEEVHIWMGNGGYCRPFGGVCEHATVFDEQTVSVTERGTFEGSFHLSGVGIGSYQLMVEVDGEQVASHGVSVSDYVKPAYTLTVTPDRKAMFAGEEIGFTVHGEFFEGTPVKGLEVHVEASGMPSSSDSSLLASFILDEAGNARGSFRIPYEDTGERRWRAYPTSFWLTASPVRPEEGDVRTTTEVRLFGPRVYLEATTTDATVEKGIGTVQVAAREVQAMDTWDGKQFASAPRMGQAISGSLIEITYTSVETGSSYDFLRKQVVKQYRYDRQEKTLGVISLKTDEKGNAVYQFPASNTEANYEVRLLATDAEGRTDRLAVSVWQKRGYEGGSNWLTWHNPAEENDPSFAGYIPDQEVRLEVEKDGETFAPSATGSFVYFQAIRGIQEAKTSKSPIYEFPFEKRDIPGVSVYGVYFDGEAYAEVDQGWGMASYVSYDRSQKELKVEITPDKATYRPGDEVSVIVQVKDRQGNPVVAEVNVNVVDEAFYTLVSEDVDPLMDLYRTIDHGILARKVSQVISDMKAQAEGGGGGERGSRFVFKDTAAFLTVMTDTNGVAKAFFPLPDNLTSWRVTAQALASDQKAAGDAKIGLDATLPFFVTPVLRDSYLVKDQPVILFRSAGTLLGAGSTVEYDINVSDVNVKEKIFAKASETARFHLPSLPVGTHEINIFASSGDLKDSLTRSLTILESRLTKPVVKSVVLNGVTSLEGASDRLTYVTFVDGNQGKFYADLEGLAGTFGDRADEAVVRAGATKLLNELFGEARTVEDFPVSVYQDSLGIRLLPQADEEYELTAKVALLKDTGFDKERMRTFFENALYEARQTGQNISALEAAQAYAALSALDEPVLAEVQRLLQISDLGTDEKLYGALALHFSGDDEGARFIYRSLLPQLTTDTGNTFLKSDTLETTGERTALLAILAGVLREPERDALYDFVLRQPHGNTTLVLEQMIFLQGTLPTLSAGESIVSYTLRGERKIASLERGTSLTVPVSPDELANLSPFAEKGTVVAASRYEIPVAGPEEPTDARFGLTRSYGIEKTSTATFHENDLVKITLRYQVPLKELIETFEVTDLLPSGLRIITPTLSAHGYDDQACLSYPAQEANQRLTFFITNATEVPFSSCEPNTLVYYARVVTPGIYTAEPAFLRSVREPTASNRSAGGIVTIGE
ncbi:MAG TPA: Ig-like domain-containing protein [Patescibacteria group bacterium]|nr:Ig-like domain-containing protein [Patescibacteria group bacterium]